MTRKLVILGVAGLTALSITTAGLVPLSVSANSGVSVNIGSSTSTEESTKRSGVSVTIGSQKVSDGDKDCGVNVLAGKSGDTKGVKVNIGCDGQSATKTSTTTSGNDVMPAELPATGSSETGMIASLLGVGALGWGIGEVIRRRLMKS